MNNPVFDGEILLCEDNSMNQELICACLAKLGLKAITAENGKDGIEKVEHRIQNGKKLFDLIFMDIHMPVMDGFEAAQRIRALEFPKETPRQLADWPVGVPIIALTANSTSIDRKQYIAHGMFDYLKKPFTSRELVDCLLKYIMPSSLSSIQNMDMHDEKKLKIKLINSFITKNKNIYNDITKAIEDKDIKLAHRLVHTLKGNAGLLDKIRLQKAAEEIENFLMNKENHVNESAMNTFKIELDAVLNEFAPLVSELSTEEECECNKRSDAVTNTGIAVLDNGKINTLFDELEILFYGGDLKCLELIDRISGPNLRSIPGTGELIHQMEYFEFDAAKETLAQLKKIWK